MHYVAAEPQHYRSGIPSSCSSQNPRYQSTLRRSTVTRSNYMPVTSRNQGWKKNCGIQRFFRIPHRLPVTHSRIVKLFENVYIASAGRIWALIVMTKHTKKKYLEQVRTSTSS